MSEVIKLNTAQKQAVQHDLGPAIVVAGAGTGKTAVISLRIAHLIMHNKVKSHNILALTFTEKAAAEMEDRVDSLLPYGLTDTHISTFHALGDKILREHGFALGLQSDFTVMSNFQQSIIMQQVINELSLNYYKPISNPFSFVSAILKFISRLKDDNISSDRFKEFVKKHNKNKKIEPDEIARIQEISAIYTKYQDLLQQKGMIDHGDQIMLAIKLLETKPTILKLYRSEFLYILVDEFQDTNYCQNYLVKLLSQKLRNIMVVGDDDQSIYRFRGASISNILNFTKDYPDAKQIVLNNNYRSGQKILDSSYILIQNNNPYRLEIENGINKKLRGLKIKSDVVVESSTTIVEEMDFVASKIQELNKKQKINYSKIAILLRKNSQAKNIAHSLQKLHIPFVVAESQNLLEQPEIKVLLNFVRALNDPNASDALYGLMVSDLYKVSLDEMAPYSSRASRSNLSLEEYLRKKETPSGSIIESVLICLDSYRTEALDISAGQLLYKYIESSGYLPELISKANTDQSAVQKIQNISQFFNIIKEFELANSYNPHILAFWGYLNDIRQSESDILIQPSPLDSNSVAIMTLHKAKGLEFDVVFMIDLTEQTFPSKNMSDKIPIPQGLLPASENSIDWHIQEERRLFYVGMTRAKYKLYLTMSFDHGGKRLKKPSRFIEEATSIPIKLSQKNIIAPIEAIKSFAELPSISSKDPAHKYIDELGWLNLSTNQIADYLRSPKEFWYFDVLQLPKGPFHTLVYGSAIHAAIELYYRAKLNNQPVKLKNLLNSFENSWKSEGFVSLEHEKSRFESGKKALSQFYAHEESHPDLPMAVEKPFVLRLEDIKLRVSGRYDAVYSRKGVVEIRDFKTGDVNSLEKANQRLKDSLQMKIYALAWQKTHQSAVDSVSLYFVENNILAKSNIIDNQKTIDLLKKLSQSIRSNKFSDLGSSQLKFGSLL